MRILPDPVGRDELRNDRVIGSASCLKALPRRYRVPAHAGARAAPLLCSAAEIRPRRRCGRISVRAITPKMRSRIWTCSTGLDEKVLDDSSRICDLSGIVSSWNERNGRFSAIGANSRVRFASSILHGLLGKHFCEVHHRKELSQSDGERTTRLKDLAIICSNCHRMLHCGGDVSSIQQLRTILARALTKASG
jgi:HNH endonuclease